MRIDRSTIVFYTLFLLIFILVMNLEEESLKSGIITQKYYHPAEDSFTTSYLIIGEGVMLPVNTPQYSNPCWVIRIEADVEGRHRMRDVVVGEEIYNKFSVGEKITF